MSIVTPTPPPSVSAATASQQPLARPVVGFEVAERKLQPLPPVEAGADSATLQPRSEALRDGRQGGQQAPPAPGAQPAETDQPASTFALATAAVAAPRFRPNLAASGPAEPAPVATKRRSHDLQAALDTEPRTGQLLNDSI